MSEKPVVVRPLNVTLRHGSEASKGFYKRATMPAGLAPSAAAGLPGAMAPGVAKPKEPAVLASGLPSTPEHDLLFHGGRIIPSLKYFNYYVGGSSAWVPADVSSINTALETAMKDQNLNNVMSQYFQGKITTEFLGSDFLAGPKPAVVSQGDVESLVRRLDHNGKTKGLDLPNTVINFILPSGTVLNTDTAPTTGVIHSHLDNEPEAAGPVPHEEEDSTKGLGGDHGSIHVGKAGARKTIYYAVGVYSEILPNGTENGIVAFDKPWKNVVATFYHELNEARTDPDVDDAIRAGDDPKAVDFLGWTSKQGEECGDFPVFEANPLTLVFKEVPAGGANVPVQFQYSNAVHGPEGPIAVPHAGVIA